MAVFVSEKVFTKKTRVDPSAGGRGSGMFSRIKVFRYGRTRVDPTREGRGFKEKDERLMLEFVMGISFDFDCRLTRWATGTGSTL